MIRTTILDAKSRLWTRALERCRHDVYHLPGYVKVTARHEGGEPVAIIAESGAFGLLVPLVIRELPEGLGAPPEWVDAAGPYGYPCPLVIGEPSTETMRELLQALLKAAGERRIATLFLRLHPLLSLPEELLGAAGQVVEHGETVYVDLTAPAEELWRQTRSNHRNAIRKLERSGFTARMNDWGRLPEFVAMYTETMRQVDAGDFYFFSSDYFTALREELGSRLHLCLVTSASGDLACGGLFTEEGGIVQFHLAGTAASFRREAPSKLMLHHVRAWAKERGNELFHLGGGVGSGADKLFEFKARFSRLRGRYRTWRVVVDREMSEELTGRRLALGPVTSPGFFPPYRAPAP